MKGSIQDQGHHTSVQIDESLEIGRGATARVCPVTTPGFEDRLAKLYRDPAKINEPRLEAMLDNPPSSMSLAVGAERDPQYAWPTHLLRNGHHELLGYLIYRIDERLSLTLDFFYDRDLIVLRNLQDECSLTVRLTIGRNLCALLSDLHTHGHCVVDFKPQNIRVFRRAHTVALLDCDSFRITGKDMRIFPATNYSSEDIAPEGLNNPIGPAALSEGQDRFAVAIVLFQLLNNGIHPFQGILLDGADAPTTDEKIRGGLYAYGTTPHNSIRPLPQSIHGCFDRATRRLFDHAFTATKSLDRPTAFAWREHFDHLLEGRQLERCARHPNDPNHIRFPGMPCGVCHFEGVIAKARKATAGREATSTPAAVASPSVPVKEVPRFRKRATRFLAAGILLFGGPLIAAMLFVPLIQDHGLPEWLALPVLMVVWALLERILKKVFGPDVFGD